MAEEREAIGRMSLPHLVSMLSLEDVLHDLQELELHKDTLQDVLATISRGEKEDDLLRMQLFSLLRTDRVIQAIAQAGERTASTIAEEFKDVSEAELPNVLRAEEEKLEIQQTKLFNQAFDSCAAFTEMSDWIQTSARVLEGLELHMNGMKKELQVCVATLESTKHEKDEGDKKDAEAKKEPIKGVASPLAEEQEDNNDSEDAGGDSLL